MIFLANGNEIYYVGVPGIDMSAKPKTRWYKFWIRSSRGTDCQTYLKLPHRLSKQEIRERLESWCSDFGAWHVSENHVEYGWEKVRKPPEKWLKKRKQSCGTG